MAQLNNKLYAEAIKNAGLDLSKDFFALCDSDIVKVNEIRRAFRYRGESSIGRSRAQMFWYAAQRGNK